MAEVIIVDENDNVLYFKEREATLPEEIRRVTRLHLINEKGEYLIALRQTTKVLAAGKWGPSASGTVEKGETYEENVYKEAKEELGLTDTPLTFLKKELYQTINSRGIRASFYALIPSSHEFVLQKSEVAAAKWMMPKDIFAWYDKSPEDFVPSFPDVIDFLKKHENTHS